MGEQYGINFSVANVPNPIQLLFAVLRFTWLKSAWNEAVKCFGCKI